LTVSEETTLQPGSIPASEAELLAGTERRIARAMWVLGVAGTVACAIWGGFEWGAGFAAGAALSALNFRWMKAAVTALADAASGQLTRPADPQPRGDDGPGSLPLGEPLLTDEAAPQRYAQPGRGTAVAARFVLRYALIGFVGYAIFISSIVSLAAFFLGLFLFIAAILAEVAHQIYGAFRSP
jgi:hypothetical protein